MPSSTLSSIKAVGTEAVSENVATGQDKTDRRSNELRVKQAFYICKGHTFRAGGKERHRQDRVPPRADFQHPAPAYVVPSPPKQVYLPNGIVEQVFVHS